MKKIFAFAMGLAIISSCSTSSEVASNKLFQKRKYQKGWHVNSSSRIDKSTKVIEEEESIAQYEESVVVTQTKENDLITEATASINPSLPVQEFVSAELNEEANSVLTDYTNYLESTESTLSSSNTEELMSEAINFQEGVNEVVNSDIQEVSAEDMSGNSSFSAEWWMFVLCFFIPWLAVGLVTNWDIKTVVINLLWSLLCGFPAIIHALIVVSREG